jgi:hypothetical protein
MGTLYGYDRVTFFKKQRPGPHGCRRIYLLTFTNKIVVLF